MLRDAARRKGQRVRLIAADDQAAHFRLVIDQMIGVAHGRHALRGIRQRIGNQILMLNRKARHPHTHHLADLVAPHAGAIDQEIAAPVARLRLDAGHAPVLDLDAGDTGADHDAGPLIFRPLGQRLAHTGRVDIAVGGDINRRAHILGRHDREEILRLPRRELVHLQPKTLRHGERAFVLHLALGRTGKAQAAVFLPVDRHASFGLEPVIELDRMPQHARHVARGAELADQPRGMPGGAMGDAALFQDDDILFAHAGEMIGNRAADNAGADDDDLGMPPAGRGVTHG